MFLDILQNKFSTFNLNRITFLNSVLYLKLKTIKLLQNKEIKDLVIKNASIILTCISLLPLL